LSHGVQMLDQGMVIEEGPPEQVFGAPVHERTRRFLRRLAWEDQAI
jgi:ABC-type histidine transport system ATPase subunit